LFCTPRRSRGRARRQLHLELALVVERGDVQVGVVHLDTGRRRDVGGGDGAGALLAQVHHDRLVVLAGDDEPLRLRMSSVTSSLTPGRW
jgi:hypothetical protein